MNVLILAAAKSDFDTHDAIYPACLTEIDGIPIIERVVNTCSIDEDCRFTFALRKEDMQRYHLDGIASLLVPDANIVCVENNTLGAACTALLATEWIDNDDELLIASSNELLNINLHTVINEFRARSLDAGVITFSSIHPRYSYIRLDEQGLATEVSEKNPISRHALTGLFWFACGKDFVQATKNMIRKNANLEGLFYIAPTLNEMILENRKIGYFSIDVNCYHPLKTERQLDRFENTFTQGS